MKDERFGGVPAGEHVGVNSLPSSPSDEPQQNSRKERGVVVLGVMYPPAEPGTTEPQYVPLGFADAIAHGQNDVLFYDPFSSAERMYRPATPRQVPRSHKRKQEPKEAPKRRLKAIEAVIQDLSRLRQQVKVGNAIE